MKNNKLLTIILIILNANGGTIWPGRLGIDNNIANRDEYSNYKFIVKPETTVPTGGAIEILFPIQYQAGLGITTTETTTCNKRCSINSNLVTFYFDEEILANVETELQINAVKNPKSRGGTGNFIIRSKRFDFVYDENLIFSVMGIADSIVLLSSTIVTSDRLAGTYKAGQPSKYNFAFKTNTNLPQGTKIKLGIPTQSGFEISDNPSCNLYPINGRIIAGQIKCSKEDVNQIAVIGFEQEIGAGTEVGISVSLTNPKYSLITGQFQIAAFRERTSVIYTWKNDINSIQITPGDIKDVILAPLLPGARVALGKVMDYKLSFLPSNPMPEGSIVKIEFPSTFQQVKGSLYDYVFVQCNITQKNNFTRRTG